MAELSNTPTRTRRVWRWLGFGAAAILILIAITIAGLQSPPAKRYVLNRATQLLAAQDIAFSSEGFNYNLFKLSTELNHVRLVSPRLADAPPFLEIDRARIDLSAWQLLRGRYVIQASDADGVRVHYFVNEQGVDNLPRPVRDPNAPSEPIDYLISHLTVPDAFVRYENRAQQIDITLPRTSMSMKGDALTGRHDVTIDAPGGDARMRDRAAHIERINAILDLGRDDVKIESADVRIDGVVLTAAGSFGPFDRPSVDIASQVTVDASRAAAIANFDEPIGGQVNIEARINGDIGALTVDAKVRGNGVRFRELDQLNIDAAGTYSMGQNVVHLSSLNVSGPSGVIKGTGDVAINANAQSNIAATVEALRAEPLMRSLRLPYRVATRVDGQVSARWPGLEYAKATGDARIFLTPTAAAASRSTLPLGGRVDIDGNGEGVTATLRNVRTLGAELNGRVALRDRDRINGTWQAHAENLQASVVAVEAFLGRPRGSLLPMSIGGALNASGAVNGRTTAPIITASIDAPSLSIGDATGVALGSDLRYGSDALAIDRFEMTWQDARATARGSIGLTGNQPLALAVRADALQVGSLLRAFELGDVPAAGTINAQAQVGGTLTNPIANLHLQGADLIAYDEVLGNLTADGRVANRRLDVTSLVLDKPQPAGNGRLAATGSYHLDAQRFSVDLTSRNVQLLTLTLPDGRHVTGTIDLAAKGSGTRAAPVGTVNLRANSLTIGDYALGDIVADTTLADARATTVATAQKFGLNAKSTIGIEHPYPATVTASVNDLDLAALPVKLQTPLEGKLRAHVEADGALADPRRGRATATIETFAGSFHQQPFQLEAPAHVRYAGERLAIDDLRVRAQDSHIAVSGDLPLLDRSAPGTITIDANANLATLAQYAPVGSEIAADGRLTVTGTLQGTLEAINPNLRIAVQNGLILAPAIEPGISNLNATAVVADGNATVDQLTANWGSAQIDLSARVPLDLLPELPVEIPRQGGPATVRASVNGLAPSAIPGAPAGLTGRISFDAEVASRRPDIRDAEGKVAFKDLQLGFSGLTLEQKGPSTISLRDGTATIDQFSLGGSVGTLAARGSVGLTGDRALNVDVDGGLNIAAIAVLTDRVRAEGASTIDVAARGTMSDPILSGNVSIDDGTLVVDEPRIAAEAINARVTLDQNRINLSSLSAAVNGGTLTGKGTLAVLGGDVRDLNVDASLRDFAFDAPLDLRSLSDSDFTITSNGDDILVNGQVTIQEAGLTGDINFDTGLLASITSRRQLELTPERNALLERIRFNINVDTASPILVDNNLAKAEVSTDLRVVGTPYETGLLGRLEVAEGGLVTLNEHTYEIQRGQMQFVEDRRIFPSFDLQLTTSANSYDITLGVSGEPGDTETTLTSNPALPEPDIMAMLVTGRTLEEMRGQEYDVAREQVLSYLTGRVGSTIGRSLEKATGLSEVRIDPQLIANEADPGARLTLAEDVTDDLSLMYSVDLADSDDQIWMATYDVTRRFQTRAVRQPDNSYRFDFRHDIRKGGSPEPRRVPRVRPTVSKVTVPDDAPIPAAELRDLLGAKEGDEFDYFTVRNGTEDIEERLREAGWAQSRVRVDRVTDDTGVSINLRIINGPQVEFAYAGARVPRKIQDEVRLQWHRGVFDAQRTDDAAETLQEWLMRDDYLQAKVTWHVDDSDSSRRRVRFDIQTGPRSRKVLLTFEGASAISGDELDQVIDEQKLERQLFTDPTVVTELLQRLYREQGYLNIAIDKPRYEFEGDIARVIVPISEGPQFSVSDVSVTGNSALPDSALLVDLPVVEGDPYMPTAAENALQRIRDLYWARGYNDVRASYQLTIDRVGGRTGVAFTVDEGRQAVVSEIRIAGNDKTSERLVREQVIVKPSEPLNLQALSQSRKNLYDSGAYSVVDLSRDTIVETAAPPSGVVGALTGLEPTQKPVIVEVDVREVQPYQLRYGASYDTEGKLGGVFDGSLHNVFGKARVVGLAGRYDAQLREGRVYFSQPTLRHWPIQTTASVYYREERNPETAISDAFNVDRKGASIQQERKLKDSFVWTYGYRFERARTFDPFAITPDQFTKVSPLMSALVRETRDEVLDATRGSFSSHALSFSPQWLGSDSTYLKYFGQYFHYFPLQKERRKRFSNEIIRPRFVFATGARLGLSKGMGRFVPTSERFFAGGSTTLRGFEQNAVGPIGLTGIPLGGDAMLVLNNELRFPLLSIVDGVTFVDVGNVWEKATDFSFTDLRKTAGVGLRLRTKWVLVRTDYGFVLDRRGGERKGRFYFSIGQAF